MNQAILIRVTPDDFATWLDAHNSCEEARKAYGMTDGPVYRDNKDPNVALVHLEVQDMKRAMEWFKSDTFKEASKRAGKVRREIWTAERPAMPASATGATSGAALA
jgi:heme-degrading monooxygenase HmoA